MLGKYNTKKLSARDRVGRCEEDEETGQKEEEVNGNGLQLARCPGKVDVGRDDAAPFAILENLRFSYVLICSHKFSYVLIS